MTDNDPGTGDPLSAALARDDRLGHASISSVTSLLADDRRAGRPRPLVESRSMPAGVTILTHRPAGRATFGRADG
jgi:hypothetical protein